jgi:group I intron endonuclease
MTLCGIYLLTHIATGRKYVGQSINIQNRLKAHKNGRSCSRWLARAITLYGWDEFKFDLLEQCDRSELNERECAWIALHDCIAPKGFNLTSGGRQQFLVCDATRAKIRAAKQNISDETRARIGAASKGRKFSADVIAKRSAKMIGRKRSEDTRAKQSTALKGRVFSPEHRARISASATARMLDPEVRRKIAERSTGKKASAETRMKMSISRRKNIISADQLHLDLEKPSGMPQN